MRALHAGAIEQMHNNVYAREVLWDVLWPGQIPPSPVTAVAAPGNCLTLEGHDLRLVDVGHADCDDSAVVHAPDLDLVVAGDAIQNGVHVYLAESAGSDFGPWRKAIDAVAALAPRHIVASRQNKNLDDDAARHFAETRQYLDDPVQNLILRLLHPGPRCCRPVFPGCTRSCRMAGLCALLAERLPNVDPGGVSTSVGAPDRAADSFCV